MLEVRGVGPWPPEESTQVPTRAARAIPCPPGGESQAVEVLSGLTIEGARGGAPGVRVIPSGGPAYLRVPFPRLEGGGAVQNVDFIRITARVPGFARFIGILGYQLPWRAYTGAASLARERDVAEVLLPILSANAHGRDIDFVTLLVQGASAPLEIYSVEAVMLADSERLPAPGTGAFVSVGSESRPSHGLLPGGELTSELPDFGGGRVTVGFATPDTVPVAEGARASARLLSGDRVVASASTALTAGWTDVELAVGKESPTELRLSTTSERGVLCSTPLWRAPAKAAPRTVLLVTSDTHRADHVGFAQEGAAASAQVRTPAMDALAARGLVFDNARSVSSTTNPSHASILTGLSPRDTGIHGNLSVLSERAETLAERFQRAGFRTFASTSARHLAPRRSGFGQGFERFAAPPLDLSQDGGISLDSALSMLQGAEGDDVFLWLHFFDVHGPYRAHDGARSRAP
ncbi:MAG: sulfatase-like hydrolase/transferase [Planctomycetota bacterium]